MVRDPEADRYELQAHRERQDALGRALYERRRPNAPKTWAELDERDQTEWILIAVDQARGGAGSEVLLELESRLGPNPLSPDDPPNVHPVSTEAQAAEQARQELRADPELRRGVKDLLGQMEALSDEQDAAEPHCLLVSDPQTKRQWVMGPFRNRLEARIAVPLIEARYRKADPDFLFTYTPMIFEKPPWETA